MPHKFYAGIGSRETPPKVLKEMKIIADMLAERNFTLRSGGADGADTAFESGARDNLELYLPWRGFNGREKGIFSYTEAHSLTAQHVWKHRQEIGNVPISWYSLKSTTKLMMTRNICQVLGYTMKKEDHSKFVVCWTKDGEEHGGTAQAIFTARLYEITVYNLAIPIDRVKLTQMLRHDF